MSKIVNLKKSELEKMGYRDFKHWLNSSQDHVYIGRSIERYVKGATGSKWGNPYREEKIKGVDNLVKYEEYVRNKPELINNIIELDGKVLGCWCVPYEECHGSVLIKLLNEQKQKK